MGRRSRRNPDAHRERGKGRPTATTPPKLQTRRVLLQRPGGTDDVGSTGLSIDGRGVVELAHDYERSLGRRRVTESHPVVRLTEDGIHWGHEPGPSDEVGYCMDMYRGDDCLQAAIATVTQVPIERVPDLALDRRIEVLGEDLDEVSRESWERIDSWARKQGLAMRIHEEVPVPRERWIGVVCWHGPGLNDHCLVMSHDRQIFDPSCSVKGPRGMAAYFFDPSRIDYGISFDKEE